MGLAVAVALGVGLSACGNSGTDLAKQACQHVNRSIAYLEQANRQTDSSTAAALQQKAYEQLRQALPIASEAAFRDGQWQSLMTTVSESNRVPEKTLIAALTQQCQAADSSVFDQAPAPSSIPPPAPVATTP
jgi:hypothetical protein